MEYSWAWEKVGVVGGHLNPPLKLSGEVTLAGQEFKALHLTPPPESGEMAG